MSVQREDVNIKLIAIDMDGTLLNDEQLISDENRNAIREAEDKGVYVVISTGRTLMTCRELAESLKLSSFLITANGSEIWDSNFNLVERKLLHTDHIKMMWDLRNKHNTNFWASTVNKVWRGEFPENITDHEWLKFGFDIEDDDIRNEVLAELRKIKSSKSQTQARQTSRSTRSASTKPQPLRRFLKNSALRWKMSWRWATA